MELIRGVLAELGEGELPVTVRVLGRDAEATRHGSTGSPTLLINGLDPCAEPGRAPALACWFFVAPAGPRGLPDPAAAQAADPTGGST